MLDYFPEHLLTPEEATDASGIPKADLYRLADDGEIRAFRVGDRTMFPGASLLAYMDREKRTRDKPSRTNATPPASKPREAKPTRVVVTPSGTRFEVV